MKRKVTVCLTEENLTATDARAKELGQSRSTHVDRAIEHAEGIKEHPEFKPWSRFKRDPAPTGVRAVSSQVT